MYLFRYILLTTIFIFFIGCGNGSFESESSSDSSSSTSSLDVSNSPTLVVSESGSSDTDGVTSFTVTAVDDPIINATLRVEGCDNFTRGINGMYTLINCSKKPSDISIFGGFIDLNGNGLQDAGESELSFPLILNTSDFPGDDNFVITPLTTILSYLPSGTSLDAFASKLGLSKADLFADLHTKYGQNSVKHNILREINLVLSIASENGIGNKNTDDIPSFLSDYASLISNADVSNGNAAAVLLKAKDNFSKGEAFEYYKEKYGQLIFSGFIAETKKTTTPDEQIAAKNDQKAKLKFSGFIYDGFIPNSIVVLRDLKDINNSLGETVSDEFGYYSFEVNDSLIQDDSILLFEAIKDLNISADANNTFNNNIKLVSVIAVKEIKQSFSQEINTVVNKDVTISNVTTAKYAMIKKLDDNISIGGLKILDDPDRLINKKLELETNSVDQEMLLNISGVIKSLIDGNATILAASSDNNNTLDYITNELLEVDMVGIETVLDINISINDTITEELVEQMESDIIEDDILSEQLDSSTNIPEAYTLDKSLFEDNSFDLLFNDENETRITINFYQNNVFKKIENNQSIVGTWGLSVSNEELELKDENSLLIVSIKPQKPETTTINILGKNITTTINPNDIGAKAYYRDNNNTYSTLVTIQDVQSLDVDAVSSITLNTPTENKILEAITNVSIDGTITLNPTVDTTIELTQTITIDKNLQIENNTPYKVIFKSTNHFRVFNINSSVDVKLKGLIIQNGSLISENGAGIYNSGILTIEKSIIRGNSIAQGNGAGIYNSGTLKLLNTSIYENNTTQNGAGLYNDGNVTIANLTFAQNIADNSGGAIYQNSGDMQISHSTISENISNVERMQGDILGGGGIYQKSGSVNIKNSIIMNNTDGNNYAPNIYGNINSYGNNIFGSLDNNGTIVQISGSDNINIINGVMDSFDTNVSIPIYHLFLNSMAIDNATCLDITGETILIDQNGITRPQGLQCDIGAFELEILNKIDDINYTTTVDINDTVCHRYDFTLVNEKLVIANSVKGDTEIVGAIYDNNDTEIIYSELYDDNDYTYYYNIEKLLSAGNYYLKTCVYYDGSDIQINLTTQDMPAPLAPTNVSVDAMSSDKALLVWDKSNYADGYKIYKDNNLITTLDIDTLYFLDSNVTINQTYSYKVKAYNNVGENNSSEVSVAIPDDATLKTSQYQYDMYGWEGQGIPYTLVLSNEANLTFNSLQDVSIYLEDINNSSITYSDGMTLKEGTYYFDIYPSGPSDYLDVFITTAGDIDAITGAYDRYEAPDYIWTAIDTGIENITDATYGNTIYNNGYYFITGTQGRLLRTNDLNGTWEVKTIAVFGTNDIYDIAKHGNTLVAVGHDGAGAISIDNGTTWNEITDISYDLYKVKYLNDAFYAVGQLTHILKLDTNNQWIKIDTANLGTIDFFDIEYNDSLYIAVGSSGDMVSSTDGTNWTSYNSPHNQSLKFIVYGNNKWLLSESGYGSSYFTSTDGTNWTEGNTTIEVNDLIFDGTRFVRLVHSNNIAVSDDATTWETKHIYPFRSYLKNIGYDGTNYFAIQEYGYGDDSFQFVYGKLNESSSLILKLKAHGGALQLENGEVVTQSNIDNNSNEVFTIEAWVNTKDSNFTFLTIDTTTLSIFNNKLRLYSDGGNTNVSSTMSINDGQWHHIAVVYGNENDGDTYIYIDGNLDTSDAYIYPTINGDIVFGSQTNFGSLLIDDIRIWNTVKEQVDVNSTKNQQLDGDETGLLAYYNFDERVGDIVYDITSNNNNGTIDGNVTRLNFLGDSLSFDGVDDYIDFGRGSGDSLYLLGDISVNFWYKFNDLADQSLLHFSDTGDSAVANQIYGLNFYSSILSFGHEYGDGADQIKEISWIPNINKWYHFSMVRDATNKKWYLYIDGKLTSTYIYTESPDGGSSASLKIGEDLVPTDSYNTGMLHEISIWNKILNENEIKKNMHSSLKGAEVGLVGYWSLNEGDGVTAYDKSSNTNDGTISGATWTDTSPIIYGDNIYATQNYISNYKLKPENNTTTPTYELSYTNTSIDLNTTIGVFTHDANETSVSGYTDRSATFIMHDGSDEIDLNINFVIYEDINKLQSIDLNLSNINLNENNITAIYAIDTNGSVILISDSLTDGNQTISANITYNHNYFIQVYTNESTWWYNFNDTELYNIKDDDNNFTTIVNSDNAIISIDVNDSKWNYSIIGKLDISFDTDGIVTTDFNGSLDQAYSVALQNDGKILVVGESNNSSRDFGIARYNENGSLDSTFASDGKISLDFVSGVDYAQSIKIQTDGKIVVAGTAQNGSNNDFAIARYESNGTIDMSFGIDGKIMTDYDSDNDYIYDMKIQTDGKILTAGYGINNSSESEHFLMARYELNGTLNTSFGIEGIVATDFIVNGSSTDDKIYSINIQGDGKIIAVGYIEDNISIDIALARYDENGSLDDSFGISGKVITPIGLADDYAFSSVIQSDGKIVVTGQTDNNITIVRYDINGSLDDSFGISGKVITNIVPGNSEGSHILIQDNNKIIVTGSYNNGTYNEFLALRYNLDGTLDTTFDWDGYVTTSIGSEHAASFCSALQNEDKIIIVGYSYNGNDYDFTIIRYK